jgi:hypothetical protein
VTPLPHPTASSERRLELAHDCQVFVADLLQQPRDRFEVAGRASSLGLSQSLSEKSSSDSAGARFECVRRALNRFRVSFFHRLLQGREARGSILHERLEQSPDYLLDAGFAKVCAKARQVYVRRCVPSSCAL